MTSNNLNSMGFNSFFFYYVQHLAYCLFMDTLKLTTHPVIYGVKAEFPTQKLARSLSSSTLLYVENSRLRSMLKRYWLKHIKATFVEDFFVLLQSLSAKIASMSISELLPNRPAAAMIPDDNNAREIIRYFIDVQKRAKFLGVISSHAQIPKPIFFLRAHCNGKRGLFLFTYRKYCYYFPSSFYSKV